MTADDITWPVTLRGTTETVVATSQPSGAWNLAALGVTAGDPVTATTWGRTRTRRNFQRTGEGYVQFVTDPVLFVDAALGVLEVDDPIHAAARAWVRIDVESLASGTRDGTDWERWALVPTESATVDRSVPTINRGHGAVIEASVAASRLEVDAYDRDHLERRLQACADIVDRTGGPREKAALERLVESTPWGPSENE